MDLSNVDIKEWQNALVREELVAQSIVSEPPAS